MKDNPWAIVSTSWLEHHFDDPDLRIIDASWHFPSTGRNARAEYEAKHIPGAIFFDIDEVSDQSSPYPHMAPSPEMYMSVVSRMGIGDGHQIVVYDSVGLFSAARVWWLFRYMGHLNVAVLDGGLRQWIAEGRQVSDEPSQFTRRHMTARVKGHWIRDVDEVARAINDENALILDARPADRFRGEAPEPRPGLKCGHIPNSVNLPFTELLNQNGLFRDEGEIEQMLREAGVEKSKTVITSCGSGVTAPILILALEVVGHRRHALYDGSWSEWGSRDDMPISCE